MEISNLIKQKKKKETESKKKKIYELKVYANKLSFFQVKAPWQHQFSLIPKEIS